MSEKLEKKLTSVNEEIDNLVSRLGYLTQERLILTEALNITKVIES